MSPHRCTAFMFCICLLPVGCQSPSSKRAASPGEAHRERPSNALRLRTIRCIDRQGFGSEAFTLLAPADWRFEGGVQWLLDNPASPARASFRIWNPQGSEEFEAFPAMTFAWSNSPMFQSTMPPGSRYFGNEVYPPVTALEALRRHFLPRVRGNLPGLRISMEQEVPEKAAAQGNRTSAAKLRLEYQSGARRMEEEISGVVIRYDFPVPTLQGVMTQTSWTLDYLWSCRAEHGGLEKASPVCETITGTFRINPKWFARYNQLVQLLVQQQIQHINSLGALSRYISRTNDEINDMIMQCYRERQTIQDRAAENFSQAIRGVDEYVTPSSERVELPGGFRHAWQNGSGEYILTDDSNFNPNLGSTQTWTELKRRP